MDTIYLKKIDSPLGELTIGSSSKGICLLTFDQNVTNSGYHKILEEKYFFEYCDNSKYIDQLIPQLNVYFKKQRKEFDIPIDLIGTSFQISVWNELQKIPYGVTRTYKEQAIAIGNLKAIRAVAAANGKNKIAILIPCHRIIGSNGNLTGFSGGLWRKKYLLELEANQTKLF